jgi:hypothetical protein
MKERGVLASAKPGRITVRSDVFGIRGKRVLHLIACQFRTLGRELPSQVRQYLHLKAAAPLMAGPRIGVR